ncbi:hypothetical protein NC239_06165 [Streptomyces sp. G3]|uniref:hypothetical protein n=1 Tax=unclassified Streptomyces TaxID=2593676 RepID=UPI0013CC23F4|nr:MULTISPECIES: hypothetical protein [unclassified Streptomyces]MCM1937795.1 hypothetical protein [Streptomyces sp. G3]NDZ71383.1 hypothetical protein [Streptomyces sp. SID10362]QUW93086.1 hypothetical protein KE639_04334 [Streptomyces sp. V17-9]WKX19310.1 hypothetical protein Q3Y68_15145 [Streptomyces sp. HUAS CX7]
MIDGSGYSPYGPTAPTLEDWKSAYAAVKQEVDELRSKYQKFDDHFAHKAVNASNQLEYFSNQLVKWDMEALAITPTGITFAGAEVYKFPWVTRLENTRLGIVGRARRAGTPDDEAENSTGDGDGPAGRLADLERTLRGHDLKITNLKRAGTLTRRTLTTHGLKIRQLAAGQSSAARQTATSVARQARQAEQRAQRSFATPSQRRSARAEADQLRQVQRALRDVQTQADSLSRALA